MCDNNYWKKCNYSMFTKINKHKLFQEIRDKRWIEQVKIIQSITINGFVYKKWIEELRKIELKTNFTQNN